MAEFEERYQGNGDTAAATAEGGYAQAEYAATAAAAPAAGGSPPADSKPAGFSDHAGGRSSQPQQAFFCSSITPVVCSSSRCPTTSAVAEQFTAAYFQLRH